MKHLKAANQKAELVEKTQAVQEDVVGMAMQVAEKNVRTHGVRQRNARAPAQGADDLIQKRREIGVELGEIRDMGFARIF